MLHLRRLKISIIYRDLTPVTVITDIRLSEQKQDTIRIIELNHVKQRLTIEKNTILLRFNFHKIMIKISRTLISRTLLLQPRTFKMNRKYISIKIKNLKMISLIM